MSKYNTLKFLKETKARLSHICGKCGGDINKGDIYYSESIGRVNAPGVKLRKFCYKCGSDLLSNQTYGNKKIINGKFII